MKVQLVLDIPKLKTTKEAQDFASNLCEHVVETFNDDNSIRAMQYTVPKIRKDKKS